MAYPRYQEAPPDTHSYPLALHPPSSSAPAPTLPQPHTLSLSVGGRRGDKQAWTMMEEHSRTYTGTALSSPTNKRQAPPPSVPRSGPAPASAATTPTPILNPSTAAGDARAQERLLRACGAGAKRKAAAKRSGDRTRLR
ncbi:uncharacterized protein K452DRAFT_84626 [Aplosporella prunicola CBS 121167]|uniref:Uncharacterized protein n=1 Tax=Aplosporella prunicola CBS 121167 TaxID=1176127 RepID=A0A6A6B3H8_9PEZI|nr:uncharacterized protein K452DRAFT_84626 [Aplosporella prunicola CBS 121167]KAF2138792.1 hypothetical protein K452DRAFT_84626 [Aplosporella prunicola CBS 121167]